MKGRVGNKNELCHFKGKEHEQYLLDNCPGDVALFGASIYDFSGVSCATGQWVENVVMPMVINLPNMTKPEGDQPPSGVIKTVVFVPVFVPVAGTNAKRSPQSVSQ